MKCSLRADYYCVQKSGISTSYSRSLGDRTIRSAGYYYSEFGAVVEERRILETLQVYIGNIPIPGGPADKFGDKGWGPCEENAFK